MSIDIPDSAAEVENRAKTDVQRQLPNANPFLKNSWLGALVASFSNRIYDFYLQLQIAIRENFADTATGDNLSRFGAIWGKTLLSATKSTGNCTATGLATTVISSGTSMASGGLIYTSTTNATITAQTLSVASITRSGQNAVVTTDDDHGLGNNVPVTISGAVESAYNVTDAEITVTGLKTFAYTVAGSPATPATGTIEADFTAASVPIESDDFGAATNLDAGTNLKLQTPLLNVDDLLTVDFGEIGGGADQETQGAFRTRVLDRIQNPVSHFNVDAIIDKAKEVAGVTRVFVQPITPGVGQVTIYFMRDNDANPIPSASEVNAVKAKIIEIAPANTDTGNDVIVSAPTPITIPFLFSSITPSTPSMLAAVTANLDQFFKEDTVVDENVQEDAYRAAIFNTIDTLNGEEISDFELISPAGDITVGVGEIPVLGTVTA